MKSSFLAGALVAGVWLQTTPQPQRDWIDPDTTHRVIRLTDDAGGSTLYGTLVFSHSSSSI